MLEALSVCKSYLDGVQALVDVDLAVERGETVALIGESGSGKTTLLRLFNRTVEPTSGTVKVDGELVGEQNPIMLRRRIGFVPQEGGLMPHWTVRRNVELVPRLLGWPESRRRNRVHQVLESLDLDPLVMAGRYPNQLSGGQRQRVAFARALAADPAIVLLDEPFGALDAISRQQLQSEYSRLHREWGKTTLLVTHDIDEALLLADRIAIMREGRVVQLGTPRQLLTEPAEDYVERLLRFRRHSH